MDRCIDSGNELTPSLKTVGVANNGTPDTRGIGEEFVDGITSDDVDNKADSVVNYEQTHSF